VTGFQTCALPISDIFSDPTSLPPQRERDHLIHLIPGANPVNVGPYRYPQFQKNEIEKLISKMLDKGTIKPASLSPYSSPVLLIKKRMVVTECV